MRPMPCFARLSYESLLLSLLLSLLELGGFFLFFAAGFFPPHNHLWVFSSLHTVRQDFLFRESLHQERLASFVLLPSFERPDPPPGKSSTGEGAAGASLACPAGQPSTGARRFLQL